MDGERPSGSDRGRAVPARTDANGNFSYLDKPKVAGIYILELQEPFVVRVAGEPAEDAKGNIACKQLDGSSNLNVVVSREGCFLIIVVKPRPL
jgi:hypothetical protein